MFNLEDSCISFFT